MITIKEDIQSFNKSLKMKWVQGYLSIEYFKVIAALKQFKKVCLLALDNPSTDDTVSLLSHSNINKESYKRLVQNKASSIPLQSQEKWLSEKDIVRNSTVNWRNAYYLPFLCTRETKLRVFQFKFLHM